MLLERPYWLSAVLHAKCALTNTLLTDTHLAILLHFPTQSFRIDHCAWYLDLRSD